MTSKTEDKDAVDLSSALCRFADDTSDFVVVVDREGRLAYVNPAAARFLGCAPERRPGRSAFDFLEPEQREPARRALASWLSSREGAPPPFESRQKDSSGRVRHVRSSVVPLRSQTGEPTGFVVLGSDVTARHEAEAALVSDLERARDAGASTMRALAAVADSASYLAHEIKNPITSVNVALRAVADRLDEDQEAVLEDLAGRMRRLEELLRAALVLARRLEPSFAKHRAAVLLASVVASLRARIEASEADVRVDVSPPDLELVADARLLEEALSSLVINAIEAKPSARIRLSASSDAEAVRLAVEDDGPGVPEVRRASLFEPFASTKRDHAGTGLAISRRIVAEHGGRIGITESPLGGARFEIVLPHED